ncbi:MAG: hypothetical protein JSU63_18065 [Phycisphaerales bacterium]|nr:MAG: hypothetical protein JSU63_18065 [Phycisphaerales bacterium]
MSFKADKLVEKGLRHFGHICALIGFIVLLRAAVRGPVSYEVKVCAHECDGDTPEMYLVRRSWWGFASDEYPLRHRYEDGSVEWEYKQDGQWKSLLFHEAGYQIDIGDYGSSDRGYEY